MNIPRGRAALNIPRHLVTVRFLKLPSSDDNEIRKMAGIEALKHVPYADEDIVSGCRIIGKSGDGYSDVMIAVAQADTVKNQVDILRKAGLSVEFASLGSETLLLWYLSLCRPEDESPILLANVDTGHIDIDIITGKALVFTRGVSYDESEPKLYQKIADHIIVSMAVYRKESAKAVSKIILAGFGPKVNELKSVILRAASLALSVNSGPKDLNVEIIEQKEESSFVELLGLAYGRRSAEINLLPVRAQEDLTFELVKKNVTTTLVVSALIIMMAFGVVLKKLHDKRAYISYVNARIASIEPQVRTVKKMAKATGLVVSKIAERPLAIDILDEIFRITPPGISLTAMEYESHKTITIRGSAPDLSDIFKYVAILGKSRYFRNVKVRYANKRVGQSVNAADFEIICPL